LAHLYFRWLADKLWGNQWAGIEFAVSLHFLVALYAMYAYCRIIKVSATISVYAAIFYITIPFLLLNARSWMVFSYCAFYMAAGMACLEAWFRSRGHRYLIVSALLKTGFLYQGNVQFVFIYLAAEGCYFLVRLVTGKNDKPWNSVGLYALSASIAISAALPLLLPLNFAVQHSFNRGDGLSLHDSLLISINPVKWLLAQVFAFRKNAFFGTSSVIFHIGGGIFLVITLIVFLLNKPKSKGPWLAVLAVLLIGSILSTKANAIIHWLPPFNNMRWPIKWYFLCPFAYAATAGLVFQFLWSKKYITKSLLHGFFLLAIVSNLIIVFSPQGLEAFSSYRLPSNMGLGISPQFTKGRTLPYQIAGVEEDSSFLQTRTFNLSTLLGEYSLGGYDPIASKEAVQAACEMTYESLLPQELSTETLDRLSHWSVRYIIAENNDRTAREMARFPQLAARGRIGSELFCYENNAATPFAFFPEQGNAALPIIFSGNKIVITANHKSGLLKVSVVNQPGWMVSFDGGKFEKVEYPTNDSQLQIPVPANTQCVIIKYSPPLLKEMLYMSMCLIALQGLVWIYWARRMPFSRRGKNYESHG
jgi:hypothetical protein